MCIFNHDWSGGGMSIFDRQFTTSEVASLSGISTATLHSYLKRGLMITYREKCVVSGGGARGKSLLFTWHSLIEVAVASAILKASNGGDPNAAFNAAARFAHVASDRPLRRPGLPFHPHQGLTLFCVAGDDTCTVAVQPDGRGGFPAILHRLGNPEAFVVVNAHDLVKRIVEAVGEDFGLLMKSAYPEES